MAKYEMLGPDGKKYEYEADDSWTPEQVEQNFNADWELENKAQGIDVRFPGQERPKFDPTQFGEDWKGAKSAIDALPELERESALKSYYDMLAGQEREATRGTLAGRAGQFTNDMARQFGRNLPIVGEWLDEARAGYRSGGDPELYSHELEKDRAVRRAIDLENEETAKKMREAKKANPFSQFGPPDLGELVGIETPGDVAKAAGVTAGLAAPAGPAIRAGGSVARTTGVGAGVGAVYGGAEAAGASEGDVEEKIKQGIGGATVGGLVGGAASNVAQRFANKALKETLAGSSRNRDLPDDVPGFIKQRSRLYYRAADADNIGINNQTNLYGGRKFGESLRDEITQELGSRGYNSQYREPVSNELQRLLDFVEELPQNRQLTIGGLENIRRQAGGFANKSSTSNQERAFADAIVERIDGKMDEMLNVFANQPAGSKTAFRGWARKNQNPEELISFLRKGRQEHARHIKAKLLTDAVSEAAQKADVGQSYDKVLVRGMANILKTPRNRARFTADEIEVMEELVRGNRSVGVLRKIGGLDNFLGRMFGMGSALHGDPLSATAGLGMAGAGKAAKATVDRKSARLAGDLIRSTMRGGGKSLTPNQAARAPIVNRMGAMAPKLSARAAAAAALDEEEKKAAEQRRRERDAQIGKYR